MPVHRWHIDGVGCIIYWSGPGTSKLNCLFYPILASNESLLYSVVPWCWTSDLLSSYIYIPTFLNKVFGPRLDTVMQFHYPRKTFHDSGFSSMESEHNVKNSHDAESGFNPLHEDPQSTLLLNPGDFFLFFLVVEYNTSPNSPALVKPM